MKRQQSPQLRKKPVSDFELTDLGSGKFSLSGDVSFRTAESVLRASDGLFNRGGEVQVDLSQVSRTDSAGMALLLEWLSRANNAGVHMRFAGIPEKIKAIAVTAEIDEFLEKFQSTVPGDSAESELSNSSSSKSSSPNSSSSK